MDEPEAELEPDEPERLPVRARAQALKAGLVSQAIIRRNHSRLRLQAQVVGEVLHPRVPPAVAESPSLYQLRASRY